MDYKDMPLSLYGWRPSWIWPEKGVKGVEKFEPYNFLVIWSLMMQYPPLTQFGQTNLANSIFVTSQPPLTGQHGRTASGWMFYPVFNILEMKLKKTCMVKYGLAICLDRPRGAMLCYAAALLFATLCHRRPTLDSFCPKVACDVMPTSTSSQRWASLPNVEHCFQST